MLNTPKGYAALVRSLELNLEDAAWTEPLNDPLHDEYYLRDINERRCLMLLYRLMHKYGTQPLIEAGFVSRWLARQPWTGPGDDDNDDARRRNFAAYLKRCKNRISDIGQHLAETRSGRRALIRSRLIARLKRSRRDRERERDRSEHIKVVLEISMADGDGEGESIQIETSAAPGSGSGSSRPRVRDQSAEEQRLRRRHREAMVLNDGTHPPGYYDIIEREHDSNS